MNKKFFTVLVGLMICLSSIISIDSFGQDPQFSQFYAAPIYLNPAFTGSAMNPRFVANYRNQWPSISANFVTSSFSFDHYLEKINSGIGLLVTNDAQGIGRLRSTDVGLTYSYMFRLDENTNVRLGMQGSYVNKSVDYNGLVFGYDAVLKPILTDPITDGTKTLNYIDFSGGALFFNERSWFGVAAHHINRPSQSLSPDILLTTGGQAALDNSRLPINFNVQGGINIPVVSNIGGGKGANIDKQLILTPAFLYKRQGQFQQLDFGFYAAYSPMTVGVWYRGIPLLKNAAGVINQDAFVALLGYKMDNFSIGYSYDFTVSKLSTASGGAHEISIRYQVDLDRDKPQRLRQRKKELSCPKF